MDVYVVLPDQEDHRDLTDPLDSKAHQGYLAFQVHQNELKDCLDLKDRPEIGVVMETEVEREHPVSLDATVLKGRLHEDHQAHQERLGHKEMLDRGAFQAFQENRDLQDPQAPQDFEDREEFLVSLVKLDATEVLDMMLPTVLVHLDHLHVGKPHEFVLILSNVFSNLYCYTE